MEQDKRDEEGMYYYSFVNDNTNDLVVISLEFPNSYNIPSYIAVLYTNTTGY